MNNTTPISRKTVRFVKIRCAYVTDSEDSYYEKTYENRDVGVVETLISQVNHLETRLNRIEINSETSVASSCNSTIIPMSEMSGIQNQNDFRYHRDHYGTSSTKSTPQKPRKRLTGQSLPSTPSTEKQSYRYRKPQYENKQPTPLRGNQIQEDADVSSLNTTPERKIDTNRAMLGEIDRFLSNVKTIKTFSSQKNLNSMFETQDTKSIDPITFDKPALRLSDLKTDENNFKANRLELEDVDRMLQALESQQQMMQTRENAVQTIYKNKAMEKSISEQAWKCGESQETVPDLGFGMRKIMYEKNQKPNMYNAQNKKPNMYSAQSHEPNIYSAQSHEPNIYSAQSHEPNIYSAQSHEPNIYSAQSHEPNRNKPKQIESDSDISNSEMLKSESRSTSESAPLTVLERPSKEVYLQSEKPNLEKATNVNYPQNPQNVRNYNSIQRFSEQFSHSDQSFQSADDEINGVKKPVYTELKSLPPDAYNVNEVYSTHPSNHSTSVNLFSLADIWHANGRGDRTIISEKDMKKLLPKFEEEKYRRKHCEKLIQELQMKILEMQQRLAVAVQVDSAKDEAILRFHEAWEKVAQKWQSLESERNTLSKQLYTVEEKAASEVAEATHKLAQFELEMNKALDLAKNNQEKFHNLELERSSLITQLSELRDELKSTQENLESVAQERKQVAQKISELEENSLKDKKKLLEAQNEIAQTKNMFMNCQSELTTLREEYKKLEKKIKEEESSVLLLESQKRSIQLALDTVKKNEVTLQKEIKHLQEETEKTKLELRNFYQQQVEVLVRDKLKEFQDQLDQAEKTLQDELQNREQTIARTAAKQLQKITEKHRLEVHLIEEKHKEEVRLYELQFTQLKQQISMLQNKLENYQTKRNNMAAELHNVMEAQWLEAIRIINNGKSPVPNPTQMPENKPAMPKDFRSIPDLRKLLALKEDILRRNGNIIEQTSANDIQMFSKPENRNLASSSSNEHTLFHENAGNEYKTSGIFETPVNSRPTKAGQDNESELQKYIKLLLEKLPKQEESKKNQISQNSSDEYADLSSWHHAQFTGIKSNDNSRSINNQGRENRTEKPPWK